MVEIVGTPDDNALIKKNVSHHNLKTTFRVHTVVDELDHRYFTGFSYNADDTSFMHTGTITCPYDVEIQEYWTPIETEVLIYASNYGNDEELVFVGRVREFKIEGYSGVIALQGYGWKFEQLIHPDLGAALVGYNCADVLDIICDLLKIPSVVMDPQTREYLEQYKLNEDGMPVLDGQVPEEIPDIFKRISEYEPSTINPDHTISKVLENLPGNVKDINFTLLYDGPSPMMEERKTAQAEADARDTNSVGGTDSNTSGTSNSLNGNVSDKPGLSYAASDITHDKNDDRIKVNAALTTIRDFVLSKKDIKSQEVINATDRLLWFYRSYGETEYKNGPQRWINTILNNLSGSAKDEKQSELKKLGLIK